MAVLETNTLTVTANGTLPGVPFSALKDAILGKKYELSIAYVPPKVAQQINIERRNKDYIPNTLSFPLSKTSGEIILCKSVIRSQHKEFNMTPEEYMCFVVIHSMLHLKGYAHGSTMESKERLYLKRFFLHPKNETKNPRRH